MELCSILESLFNKALYKFYLEGLTMQVKISYNSISLVFSSLDGAIQHLISNDIKTFSLRVGLRRF